MFRFRLDFLSRHTSFTSVNALVHGPQPHGLDKVTIQRAFENRMSCQREAATLERLHELQRSHSRTQGSMCLQLTVLKVSMQGVSLQGMSMSMQGMSIQGVELTSQSRRPLSKRRNV